ncbi:MAG: DNA repair protein RecN [Christensenellales bacterium]|jgi:DNA repair protein RecN (Recombination protein N)
MLEQLLIHQFALFEEITVGFSSGLCVLTGETGAGKSLVVDAVSFLCGGKADKDMIRTGSDKAYVEGLFSVDDNRELLETLSALEMEAEEGTLVVSRELSRSGRSISRIDGVPVSLGVLKQVTENLIDIHGQHEHQSLLQENRHLGYLDSFGGSQHVALIESVKSDYESYRQQNKAYQDALASAQAREEQLDLLRLKDKELAAANLVSGEEEELTQSRDLLRHADRIKQALQGAYQALYEGGPDGESAWGLTNQALKYIDSIAEMDSRLQDVLTRMQSSFYEIEELGHDLRALNDDIDTDSTRLESVEERLDLIRKLSRKYGASVDEMIETWQDIKARIKHLETLDETLDKLANSLEQTKAQYKKSARMLSQSRINLAKRFEKLIEEHLKELNMASSRFQVAVTADPERFSSTGMDDVRMLIAPNLGEDFKPLAKIASGGELSRLMLALKAITAENNAVPTMVFDEIDTGISGRTSQVIARKLWDIARFRQVICVSHLHQIAAMASTQMEVEKGEAEGRTQTVIRALNEEERVLPLSIMLGGTQTMEESGRQHAKTLLKEAAAYRAKHPIK